MCLPHNSKAQTLTKAYPLVPASSLPAW